MPEEFDEFGIPIKKKRQQEVDEFGVPIKKKETGGIGSSVGALSGTGGAGLSASSGIAGKIKSKPTTKPRIEEIEAYNQRFRDITGTKSTQFTLGSELPQIKKAREEKDYLQFRQIEDNEINPVLSAVQSGTADPNQLKELYNKPYGKRVVQSAIEEVMPGASQYGLDADVVGSDRNWQEIAAKIQETNRDKGVQQADDNEKNINNELVDAFQTVTYGNERIGIEGKDEAVMKVDKNSFGKIDPNNFADLENARKKVLRADKVWGANGLETDKKSLLNKIEARQFQLKAQEQLPEEIVSNAAMIKDAVSKVPVEWKRKGGNPELVAKDAEYVMEGLNYIRESAPGEYKMIMASMAAVGRMSEQQYQDLVMLGRDINYYRKFKSGEYVEEDTRDFMTPQVKKAYLSGWLSQRLKEKRKSINTFKVSDKDILEAYKDAPEELKDDELLYELRRQEAVGSGGKGIRKTGGIYEFYHGIASPLKSVANTFDVAFDSPFEAYLKSKELDRGDQKIPQKGGGFGEDLPSNTWLNKAVGGFGSFLTQVMLARGIGSVTSGAGNTLLSMAAPRAATLTTGGMALKVGTPLSTLAQTYGDEYIDFLEKTGSPAKAGFGAFVSGLAQGYIERFVMPDVKIADNIGLLTSKRNFARDIINVVENGGGKAEIGKVVRDFVYNTTKTLGKEAILEENLQNLTNALTEQIISPKTAADRDLMQEIADVSSQSVTAMAIPSLLGGAGETKVQKGLNKAQLHHIGVNYKTYQEALDRQLARGLMSKQDHEQASTIIQLHGGNVKNAPVRDAKGELISAARQLEYAYQSTVAEVAAQQAAKQPDKIQREPLEKKAEEADKIKRQIFYGEDDAKLPPKKDEQIVIDQDRDLMDEEDEGSEFTSRPKEEILVDVPAAAEAIEDVNVKNQILSNPEIGLAEIAQQLHSTEGEASTATKYFGRDLSDLALELYPTREDADATLQQAAQPQTAEKDNSKIESDIKEAIDEVYQTDRDALDEGFAEFQGQADALRDAGGMNYHAHGMGKTSIANAFKDLFYLFNSGIDKNKNNGKLYTAPLGASGMETGGGTASGAYADSPFMLVSRTPEISDISQVEAILVNDGMVNIRPDLIDLLKKRFPGLTIKKYSEAANAVSELNNKSAAETTTPTAPQAEAAKQAETKVADSAKQLADKVRSLKINLSKLGDGGLQSNPLGLPVAVWNGAMDIVAKTIEAGGQVADAVKRGLNYIQKNHRGQWDKKGFNDQVLKELGVRGITVNGQDLIVKDVEPEFAETINGFYSDIEQSILEVSPTDKGTPQAWQKKIGTGEEAKWTGITDWLNSLPKDQKLSRQEILQWLKDNRIQVVEVVKGGVRDIGDSPEEMFESGELILYKRRNESLWFGFPFSVQTKDGKPVKLVKSYEDAIIDQDVIDEAKKISNRIKNTPATKFSQYQIEGEKSNYAEKLILLPNKEVNVSEFVDKNEDYIIEAYKKSGKLKVVCP